MTGGNRKVIGLVLLWIGLVSTIALAGPSYDISLSVDFDQGTFAGTMRVAYTAMSSSGCCRTAGGSTGMHR